MAEREREISVEVSVYFAKQKKMMEKVYFCFLSNRFVQLIPQPRANRQKVFLAQKPLYST